MERRTFLKSIGAVGASSVLRPDLVLAGAAPGSAAYFDLHPFVAAHPEAVFVKRTQVSAKTHAESKLQEGASLARELFVTQDTPGISLSDKIAVKPNLTCGGGTASDVMGIITDCDFVEGFVEGMKDLGLNGNQFYLREGNLLGDASCPASNSLQGYRPMAARTGVHLTDFDSGRDMADVALENLEEGSEVVWREVPDGVIFKRIGYVAPINDAGAWNLNISKFKAHGMGLTLATKNWQGTNVHPYVHYCSSVPRQFRDSPAIDDVQPDYRETLQRLFEQHREAGVPRWDRPGNIDSWNSGPGMEMWVHKALDNLSASRPALSIIEGIYGRNGNGFKLGPGPGDTAQDFMSNVLIFGQNAIKVDIIGHWLGGHEPGNFGLFHAALDRGLTDRLNPVDIPVYAWDEGVPQRVGLEELERTPLQTYYLQRDYDGEDERKYHLVDEPFDYSPYTAVLAEGDTRPQSHLLAQNYPNPFNSSTLIEYQLPRPSHVRLEIYNARGQRVDVLVNSRRRSGAHAVSWNASRRASGTYFYRFRTEGFQEVRKMLLVR